MTKQVTEHARAGKMIRAELKKNGVAGKVRSRSGAIYVTLTDNPLPATVAAVKDFAEGFQMGHFDGMTDCYEYSNRNADLPQVRFVFVNADYSDDFKQELWAMVRARHQSGDTAPELYSDGGYHHDLAREFTNILRGAGEDWVGFWKTQKTRVAA